MNKRLFFICPTDFLEPVINDTFKGENYFITSLGNSIAFDADKVEEINALIETKGIKEITFILSADNRIVLDAIENKEFSRISGLDNFYDEITHQKRHSRLEWKTINPNNAVLADHLDKKIQELRTKLSKWLADHINIVSKVYYKQSRVFIEINRDLLDHQISLN